MNISQGEKEESTRMSAQVFKKRINPLVNLGLSFRRDMSRNWGFSTVQSGSENQSDYRLYFKNEDKKFISPFHDIPMIHDPTKNIFNSVIEVPRWTNAKLEMSLKDKLNPIKQDMKNGKLRYVANCFPFKGYIWNYGFIPQTWEDPNHLDPYTNAKGDGDPVDICEIGQRVHPSGSIVHTKILGTLALIDEGETDWKIIGIDATDPLADSLHDIEDLEKYMPGFLNATIEWFRIYKMPDGKPPNIFAFDKKTKDRAFALNVLSCMHEQWIQLMDHKSLPPQLMISRICNSKQSIDPDEAENIVSNNFVSSCNEAFSILDTNQKWHFVK